MQWVRQTASPGGDSMNLDHSVTAYDDSMSGLLTYLLHSAESFLRSQLVCS